MNETDPAPENSGPPGPDGSSPPGRVGEPDPAAERPQQTAEGESVFGANLIRSLVYSLSLPERAVRSTVGLTAGAVGEVANLLVPQTFRDSTSYEIVITSSLQFLTENIGGVERESDAEKAPDDFLARKAVGNFVDIAGVATLHVSPLWVLAILSDAAYGSGSYVRELGDELKKKGLIDENSTILHVDDVLEALREASGEAATLFDRPPLSIDQLKQSLDRTRTAIGSADVRRVMPEWELQQYWSEMREIADREGVSLLGVSGALTMNTLGKVRTFSHGTLTGVQVAGDLFNQHVIGHYVSSLQTVRERGFYETVRESSGPYIEAVWNNFAADRETWTEGLLTGRMFGRAWKTLSGWLTETTEPGTTEAEAAEGETAVGENTASETSDRETSESGPSGEDGPGSARPSPPPSTPEA